MTIDLTDDIQFKKVLCDIKPSEKSPVWINELESFLSYVHGADLEERKTKEFHTRIWEENPVSGVGMGTVNINSAIQNSEFRSWFAEESLKPLPEASDAKLAQLQSLYNEMVKRLKAFSSRTPRVKIFRVLAACYPRQFTTFADAVRVLECYQSWFGERKHPSTIVCHWNLVSRLNDLLGPCGNSYRELAERMAIPWMVYDSIDLVNSQDADVVTTTPRGHVELKPLPASQRRKGFTSIRGGLDTISNSLRFVLEGVTREDLMDYLRAEFPDYRESSLRTLVNILKNEFYIVKEADGVILPTARGELYLETNDPQELIPLFLTRTLGVDHVLLSLKEKALPKADLISLLQKVNPGWTSDYAPNVMLKWLKDFGLLQMDDGVYSITAAGQSWADLIHWQPEFLPSREIFEIEDVGESVPKLDALAIDQAALITRVTADTAFPRSVVTQLHFGLWGHRQRHFAIMAGLSGSGKTLLAKRYAEVLAGQFTDFPARNVFIQPVQPGWYDPAPLFGYINPLVADNYIRPRFLDFLLVATNQQDQPFVVILDEMNLSHPEQYFAPVLSAMESGSDLMLHNEGDAFDGVPNKIPYPKNVAFIGTVNMDETTHGISDKVLDRAFTLEFWDINLADYPKWDKHELTAEAVSEVKDSLGALLGALAPVRMHFGWRTVEDVLSYLSVASKSVDFDLKIAMDDVLYARVLPKLRGSESSRIHDALQKTIDVLRARNLTRCCNKVESLKNDLTETGIMRFWH